jgi:hypothetical protein
VAAFRPKLLAMAGGKGCRRAMIKNKSDKDTNKDATKAELTAAYELIMLTVRNDKLTRRNPLSAGSVTNTQKPPCIWVIARPYNLYLDI